jgi:hypothetical protein
LLLVLLVLVALGLVGASIVAGVLWLSISDEGSRSSAAPSGAAPLVAPTRLAPGLWIDTNVPGSRVYLGEHDLGVAPVHVTPEHLDGSALVILAANHQPHLLAADELSRAVHDGRGRHVISLAPSLTPDRAVYIRRARPATVRLVGVEAPFAVAPGLLVVPRPHALLELIEPSGAREVVSLVDCAGGTLCVRGAGAP